MAPNAGCSRCPQYRSGRVNLCVQPHALSITRDGAFAEYVLLPADLIAQGNVLPVSTWTDVDFGALVLVEPLASPACCADRVSARLPRETSS